MKISRNKLGAIILLLVLTIGLVIIDKYNLLNVILLALITFLYWIKKPKIKDVVILALIVVLNILLQIVFIFTGSFNPVCTIVIIYGLVFNRRAGMLCGVLSVFFANLLFGMHLDTLFLMITYAAVGYFAGVFKEKILSNKLVLYGYGVICALFYWAMTIVYLVVNNNFKFDGIHLLASWPELFFAILANLIFMFILNKYMLQILNRVKIRYETLK